jgi:hypothetical protein
MVAAARRGYRQRVPRNPMPRPGARRFGLAGLIAALGVVLALGPLGAGGAATAASQATATAARAAASQASVTCTYAVQNASVNGAEGIEQSVAVNPLDTNTILVGSISSNLSSFPVVSHDCGGTWKNPTETTNFGSCTGDQSVAWDRHGNAYFSCDGTEVYHSSDDGDTWSTPVPAATPAQNMGDAIDRPWLVVDNSGGPRDGTVYLFYESFFTNPLGWVMEVSSTDHGQTWSTPTRVDDPAGMTQQDPRNFPAVGADGTLYVVYARGINPFTLPQQNPITLTVARSKDGGATWERTDAATNVVRNSSPADETEIISSLAADPSPQRAGHLALAWPDQINGESRILFEDSLDGGVTWSKPVDINDDPPGNGDNHDHEVVTFLPDGRVVVVWRDRRCCGGGYSDNFQIFARVLTIGSDGSVTPGDTVQVTDSPQPPTTTSTNEYIGASAGPEGVNVAWNQDVNGTAESFYRRLPLSDFPVPAASTPPATPVQLPPLPVAAPKPKPKGRSCRRRLTLKLPVLGEHPDVDGDRDDHWRAVDEAVLVGRSSVRGIFPRHGRLPRFTRITLGGRGSVLVTVTIELRRAGRSGEKRTRTISRRRRFAICG